MNFSFTPSRRTRRKLEFLKKKLLWWRKEPKKEEEIEVPLVVYNPYRNLLRGNGGEAFGTYFKSEMDFMVDGSYSENENHKALRNEAVKFFSKHSKSPESDVLIPYMAMTYFDRFISRNEIPIIIGSSEENRKLFLMCCLAIAWKLRTNKFDYPKFLKKKKWSFEAKDVRKMEVYICERLDWRIRTLSPIFFAEYFILLLLLPPEFPSPRRSVHQLIVRSQAEIEYTEYRPSVLAASAVITVCAMMFNPQADILRNRIKTSEFLNVESDVLSKCCEKFWRLYLILNKPEAEDSSSSDYEPHTHERSSSSDSSDERETLIKQQLKTGKTSAAVSRREGKEPASAAVSHRKGKEPASAAVSHRKGKEPTSSAVSHGEGKEPASAAVSHREAKEPSSASVSHREGKEPASAAVTHGEGKEPASAAVSHRPGKEPASAVASHRPAKEPASAVVSHRPGKEPASAAVSRRPGKEPASAAVSHRRGKEPAISEFELEPEEIGKDLFEAFDELMDFQLTWTDEADDDDDEEKKARGAAAIAAVVMEKVNGCRRDVVHRVNGMCTIL